MLARGIDIEDENAVEAFLREVMLRVAREIQQIAGPERHLYFNGMPVYAYRGLDTHIELECLPSGGWGYDFLWSSAAYARSLQRTVLYMTAVSKRVGAILGAIKAGLRWKTMCSTRCATTFSRRWAIICTPRRCYRATFIGTLAISLPVCGRMNPIRGARAFWRRSAF